MLPSSILSQLRRTANQWLKESCTIERQTEDRGAFGEQIHDFETVATDVPCRVINGGQSNTADSQMFGNQEVMLDQYRIVMPAGTVVDVDYRVTVGGRVYNVTAVTDDRTDATDTQVLAMLER